MTTMRLVRYTTTSDSAAENRRLVAGVYEQLHELQPEGFRYATVHEPEKDLFLHIAVTETGEAPLPHLSAFREFLAGLDDRVVSPVINRPFEIVGNYRLL